LKKAYCKCQTKATHRVKGVWLCIFEFSKCSKTLFYSTTNLYLAVGVYRSGIIVVLRIVCWYSCSCSCLCCIQIEFFIHMYKP